MGHKKRDIKKAERRRIEYEQRSKKRKNMMIGAVVISAVIILGVFVMVSMKGDDDISGKLDATPINDDTPGSDDNPEPNTDTEVRIPLTSVTDTAEFFSYDSNGVPIYFFAVKGSDDNIHVAMDACDVCYGAKKGYRQVDDVMHCINCERTFSINQIGTSNTAGGCWPSFIPTTIDGDDIVIEISDLKDKSYMFF